MQKLFGDRAFRVGVAALLASFALASCGASPAGGSPWVPFDDDATVLAPNSGPDVAEVDEEGHQESLATANADCAAESGNETTAEACAGRGSESGVDHAPTKE